MQPPLPATESNVARFMELLISQNRRGGTIEGYLAAIRHLSIVNGWGEPPKSGVLNLILKGAKKRLGPLPQRAAVTHRDLFQFLNFLDLTSFDDTLFWALCTMGFFGALRVSEYLGPNPGFDPNVHLTVGDRRWGNRGFEVLLKSSKTDQSGVGVLIPVGPSDSPVCAVKAMRLWDAMALRGGLSLDLKAPLFRFRDGSPAGSRWFARRLAQVAEAAGVEGVVKPHSLRIGAATTANQLGFSTRQIKSLGRWSSDCFSKYIRVSGKEQGRLRGSLAPLSSLRVETEERDKETYSLPCFPSV